MWGRGTTKNGLHGQWGQPELCGGLHLPPVGTTRSLKPWAPLRSTQEPVLRFAPACKSLCLPYMWLGCSPYKATDRSRPGARPVNPRSRPGPRGRCAPLFRGPARALFGVDGPPSTGWDSGASYGGAGRRWLHEHRRTDQARDFGREPGDSCHRSAFHAERALNERTLPSWHSEA